MNTFVGAKIIKAEPMTKDEFEHKYKNGPEPRLNEKTQDGYHVIYPDNYHSWSPKNVFDEAYRTVNWKEIGLMYGVGNFTGPSLIAHKRVKQKLKHGYSAAHDREHVDGELVMAAICYATPPKERVYNKETGVPELWPWEPEAWNPTDNRIEDFINAGALMAAEIDRRVEAGETPPEG